MAGKMPKALLAKFKAKNASKRTAKKAAQKALAGKNPKGPPRNRKLSKKEKEAYAKAMSKKQPGAREKAMGIGKKTTKPKSFMKKN